MHHQPLLVVLRAWDPLELAPQVEKLQSLGVRQVEIAWSAHPRWIAHTSALRQGCPRVHLGAASVVDEAGLEAAVAAGLGYAVSPVLDPALVERARQLRLPFVPGVMSPTEVHHARRLHCPLVKLFPAATLGLSYWQRLAGPLGGSGSLPHCIAAGGLGPNDVEAWLASGITAVALGGSLAHATDWEGLAALIDRLGSQSP